MKIILSVLAFVCMILPARVLEPYEDLPWPKHDERIGKLTAYFKKHNCPQLTYVKTYISTADKYNLPFELLPAISMQEQQCGKVVAYCRPPNRQPYPANNHWGWNSAAYPKGCFNSAEEGIETVAKALATAPVYAGKTLERKLSTYNSVNPDYVGEIKQHMININQK